MKYIYINFYVSERIVLDFNGSTGVYGLKRIKTPVNIIVVPVHNYNYEFLGRRGHDALGDGISVRY